jgi:hypothetical protein
MNSKSFFKLVSKMPFVGKVLIRAYLFKFYHSRTYSARLKNFHQILILLSALIFFHETQIALGAVIFLLASCVFIKILAIMYITANISVTILQTRLVGRAVNFLNFKLPLTNRKYKNPYSTFQAIEMFLVTFGGIFGFFFLSILSIWR